MVKNSFIEKTYAVGTHWRQLQCLPTTYGTENKEENYLKFTFSKYMTIVLTSLFPISIKIPVTLLQIVYICMTAISPNSSS